MGHRKDNEDDDGGFALFCAYHLGLTPDGRKKEMNVHDVARALGVSVDVVNADLARHRMTSARLMNLDFDLAAARDDIWASPPGVDLPSIARMHFDLLRAAGEKPRDWEREARDDAAENERIFGKR